MDSEREQTFSAEAIARAIEGDRAAVSAIAKAFLPRVYGLCLRLARRRDLAEEATQETFVRALRALPRLRDPERLASFVLTIAATTVREMARRAPREAPLDHDPPAPAPGDDGAAARRKAVERAVSTLDVDERQLFLLHTVEGVKLEALARESRSSVPALKSRLHRIRSKVRSRALEDLEREGALP